MIMIKAFSMLRGPAVFALPFVSVLAWAQTVGGPVANPSGDPAAVGGIFPFDAAPWVVVVTNADVTATAGTNAITMLPAPVELHPHFRITEDGVVGEGGAFQIFAEGNLMATPIQLRGPTGQDLRLRVAAIGASDSRTGRRIWLATLRDCHGVVLDGEPASIIWTNAFDGLAADICVQYNINSIIHDVYIREPVHIPEDAGFNPASTRLEIWTELFEGPEPRLTPSTISLVAADPAHKNQPILPDKQGQDTDLDWGAMKLIPGCAFRVNADADAAPRENCYELI